MSMKVIVVGAGLAGLSAVHTLRKAGVDVRCFESADIAGGRVISSRRDGFIMDMGAQFLFRSYNTCFQLADELGLSGEHTSWIFRVGFPDKGRFLPVVASIRPSEALKNLGETVRFLAQAGIPYRAMLQFLGILPTLVKRYKDFDMIDFERALDLDHESLTDFVLRMGGKDILEHIFHSVASAMTLADPEELSAAYGMGLLCNMINGLNCFERGLGCITERLAEKHAGNIQCGTPVDRIVIENGKVKGVEIKGSLVEADVVIPAITATKLLQMAPNLPDSLRKPLETVTYSACCHVVFALPMQLLPKGWYALLTPRVTRAIVSGFTDNSVKSKYYAPAGCSLISCWTYDHYAHELNERPDSEIKQVLVRELQRFMPAMPDEPLFTEIYRWREAVCIGQPGMLSAMARLKREHYHDVKGLYVAGEYLNMPSVESAARSGLDAGKDVLQQ